jgi:hypothetical protein
MQTLHWLAMRLAPAIARARLGLREMFAIDLRALAAFRIALGGILLLDLLLRVRFFSAMYTEGGAVLLDPPARFLSSFHAQSLDPAFQAVLFVAAGLFALMLLVGYQTRLATIASWLLLISLQDAWRDGTNGGDQVLRVLVLWSIFLPLGARLSIDARRSSAPPRAPAVSDAASAALLLQFVFIYFFTGIAKTGVEWRTAGTAIELALANEYWSMPVGQWLRGYPEILRLLTPATLWFEILGPFALLASFRSAFLRLLMVTSFWGFQLGLGVSIQLNLFQPVCAVAALPFLRFASSGGHSPATGARPWLSKPGQVGVAVLLAAAFVLNLDSRGLISLSLPSWIEVPVTKAGVAQDWRMYAPGPPVGDFSFEYELLLRDGTSLGESDPGRARRRRIGGVQSHYRFKRYLQDTLKHPRRSERIDHYLRWMCAQWNVGIPPDRRLARVRMAVHTWSTLSGGRPPRRVALGDHACDPAGDS